MPHVCLSVPFGSVMFKQPEIDVDPCSKWSLERASENLLVPAMNYDKPSAVLLGMIMDYRNHNNAVEKVRATLRKLRTELAWHIGLRWIKALAGNNRNEMADKMAKDADDLKACQSPSPGTNNLRESLANCKSITTWKWK